MSGVGSERIEPTARVTEPQGPDPRPRPDSQSRRRRPAPDDSELVEDPEATTHQVDRLA